MDKTKRDWLLPVSILIAAVMISGSIIYLVKSGGAGNQLAGGNGLPKDQGVVGAPAGDVTKLGERDVVLGDPKAPVTVVEYADFQCPFCGKFYTEAGAEIR